MVHCFDLDRHKSFRRPLTSQAIGGLRNQLYAGIVDVTEYGVRGKRGDFEPLISEDLFFRVQAVLSGRLPSTTPKQRAHPDFPLRAFVRCGSCGRGLTGSWSKGRSGSRFEVALRKSSARAGFQIALETDGSGLVSELYDDVEVPWTAPRGVWTATAIVVGESGGDIGRETAVEMWLAVSGPQDIDVSFFLAHGRTEANTVPPSGIAKRVRFPRDRQRGGSFFAESGAPMWRILHP